MDTPKPLKNNYLKVLLVIITVFVGCQPALAQTSLSKLEPAEYFDFWLGKWDLTWQASDGSTETGTNTIERILNDKVIKENFEATSGQLAGFIGKSYSVYNANTNEWKQTWVDNNGGYWDFVGKFEGDKRIFIRQGHNANGNPIMQRMVFYDITKNSFTWDWEKSTDNGATWQLQWKIAYRRH